MVVNACLDIPLILLLNALHLPPYIGTVLATCIGYITSITLALLYLRKDMKFEIGETVSIGKKDKLKQGKNWIYEYFD